MGIEIKNVLRVEDTEGFPYFMGTIQPTQIKDLTFVPVVVKSSEAGKAESLNERDTQGYQRAGDPKRMEKIRKFIRENQSSILPPVLLSARGAWKFKPSRNSENFGTLEAEDLAAIIDGQHRLGGLWRLAADESTPEHLKRRPIPFMMIENIPVDLEQKNFIDINDNQQGVKKSLLKFLNKNKEFPGQAAFALMEDDNSVFRGRISIQKREDSSLILFGAMEECVTLLYSTDMMRTVNFRPSDSDENRTKAIEYLIEFWAAIKEEWADYWSDIDYLPDPGKPKTKEHNPGVTAFRWRLLEETGIRAVSKLGSDLFIRHWMQASQGPTIDGIQHDLKKLKGSEVIRKALTKPKLDKSIVEDFDHDLKSTGKAGVDAIYRHLRGELLKI